MALDLLFTGTVNQIIINDYDKAIYSFWRAIITETKQFISMINNVDVTIDEWRRQKNVYMNCCQKYSLELGFATFYLNRTNRSGILNAGPIGGYNQSGNYLIDARFNKLQLIKKIEKIAEMKNHIKVYNKEARAFIDLIITKYTNNTFVYFDPPYFNKGNRLYKNCLKLEDHKQIATYIKEKVICDWIITYDNADQIKEIFKNDFFRIYELTYSVVRSKVKKEIIIFKKSSLCPRIDEHNIKGIRFIEG